MRKCCFSLFLILSCFLTGQQADSALRVFRQAESELRVLQHKAFHSKTETERLEGNKEFIAVWDRIVSDPGILEYPFDSLKEISVLTPNDKKFKLITWNMPGKDGTHHYFGFLLVNNSKRIKKGFMKYESIEAYESFKLLDRSASVKSPENYIGAPDKWFGMLYYGLVECDGFYTLLGYDLNDKLTRRKFVDVLSFRSNGDPVFGKDVFKFARKNPRRLMFEYSSEITMSLKYNDKQGRIIYSHLGANKEGALLDGQFQFYGPDGSYDALELRKGKWVTIEDVDARNEKTGADNVKKPNPKKHKKILPGYTYEGKK